MTLLEPQRMRDHQPTDALRLYCPLPRHEYPDHKGLVEATQEWSRPYISYSSDRDQDILDSCAYSAYTCIPPRVPHDLRVWFSCVSAWTLLSDDSFDRGTLQQRQQRYAEIAPQELHALSTPLAIPEPGRLHPLADYIWALRTYGEEHAPLPPVRMLMDAIDRALRETETEIGYAVRSELCGADEYIRRLMSGAKYSGQFAILPEICTRATIPEHEGQHPIMQGLRYLTGTLCHLHLDFFCWANDGPTEAYNIINAVAQDLGIPPYEAGAPALELTNRIMELFLRLREQLKREVGEASRTLLDDLDWMVRGNLDWGLYTTRYASDNNPMRPFLPEEQPTPLAPPALTSAPCPALAHLFGLLD
ncbi:hypothetical protein J7W19_04555 [Streptomyces mobaraensis NBRC 13819 = DSM 40847]|uniref:Terpene synthase n=1 Tax=Streptomyces mobaraensis (strain ATCC 29032 / DSM 40847 / JCM 4168 / NBRC 13819 / NCIMB 11159 / IPCR 16-22) TaxID=1223523 RepID=M3C0D1_STRM1|nr:hypothetical protein [Streptomyces mobaraensis]EME97401.1 hypothetical protein H340_26586 [Streptomyces mobaraensis NBRC 13819 = DSM 40847]QTT72802.1 hypothetical protein J7W19_04555 [Streptomyces mobaraensis NBRC 13819 = DSM 40847]